MTDPKEVNQPRETRLNELIADYLRRVERGEQVDPEQFVAAHPDLADSFRQHLQDAALVDQPERERPASPPAGKDTAESRAGEETIPPSQIERPQKDVPKSRQFGRYRIIRQLGQGAMGSVYLAEDPKLERQVALKIPKLRDEEDPESLERFYREARAAATLDHPNICSVYDIGDQDGMPFIAMAYVEGQPLSQLVGTGRMRSERDCAELVRKIALALSEAHRKGVVHRDLKSGNILVDQSDEPVVMDFGLARRIDKPGDERLTKSGTLLGTPAYMAPEQVEGDLERIGPLSDIYSLGVILYELVTGQLPFSGPVAALIAQILRDEPRPPSALRTPVNKRLEAICLKMMSKSPDARFGSAAEVAEALGELLGQTSKHPSASQPATETIRKLEAHRQRTMQLLQACEFSQAIDALERMARLHGPGTDDYATWAKRELARVKALPRELLEKGPAVVETAVELIAAHEYARAAELLRSVPDDYRSTEATKLLAKATKLETETRQLNARVQQAIGTRQYDGLQDDLNRLLEIQPGNLTARELHGKLSTYSPGQPYRFDRSGNLLPAHRTPLLALVGGILRQSLRGYARRQQYRTDAKGRKLPAPAPARSRGIPILPIAIGLAAVALVLLAIVIFFRDDGETVRVEIDEKIFADSSITLLIDHKQMEIAGLGDTIKLKPGPHGYELRRGDQVVRSGSFTVLKGDNRALEISLDEGAAETTAEPLATTGRQQRAARPPAAVAPFNEDEAKEHQQAWADYLGVPVEMTNDIGVKLVLIPPGEFHMGSSNEEINELTEEGRRLDVDPKYIDNLSNEGPRHRVPLAQPFYLAECEVTVAQFRRFVEEEAYETDADKDGHGHGFDSATRQWGTKTRTGYTWQNPGYPQSDAHPVSMVSWNDAVSFCQWLTEKESSPYRLPTEAEWEYACRAGTATRWSSGDGTDTLPSVANVNDASYKVEVSDLDWAAPWDDQYPFAAPVGTFHANAFGLHDLHGNVAELCGEVYDPRAYERRQRRVPSSPGSNSEVMLRGGSFRTRPPGVRSAARDRIQQSRAAGVVGFRVVCEIEAKRNLSRVVAELERRTAGHLEPGFVSLFDGRTLDGWQGAMDAYVVESGSLVSTPDGTGSLFTTKRYSDFVLRLEFKLEPEANNGVAIRAPLYGNPSYDGLEIQILDDDAPRYAHLKPNQHHGSIYLVAPAKRGYLNPTGQWNSQEIMCRGRQVQVSLNGTTILDLDLDQVSREVRQRVRGTERDTGYLGLLALKSRVEFRNIRIKELSSL